MAHILIMGAGIGGMPAATEMRDMRTCALEPKHHGHLERPLLTAPGIVRVIK